MCRYFDAVDISPRRTKFLQSKPRVCASGPGPAVGRRRGNWARGCAAPLRGAADAGRSDLAGRIPYGSEFGREIFSESCATEAIPAGLAQLPQRLAGNFPAPWQQGIGRAGAGKLFDTGRESRGRAGNRRPRRAPGLDIRIDLHGCGRERGRLARSSLRAGGQSKLHLARHLCSLSPLAGRGSG